MARQFIDSPIRQVLGECTNDWQQQPVSPLEGTLAFRQKLGHLADRYDTYLSTAITAGGFRRDPSLSLQDVVTHNAQTNLAYADYSITQG